MLSVFELQRYEKYIFRFISICFWTMPNSSAYIQRTCSFTQKTREGMNHEEGFLEHFTIIYVNNIHQQSLK